MKPMGEIVDEKTREIVQSAGAFMGWLVASVVVGVYGLFTASLVLIAIGFGAFPWLAWRALCTIRRLDAELHGYVMDRLASRKGEE